MVPMSSEKAHALFHALSRAHTRAHGAVASSLKSANLPGSDVFDALHALSKAGSPITATALETALDQPQYTISRLLDRMEKQGLVKRTALKEDRRSKHVNLTEKGRTTYSAMASVRDEALTTFFSHRVKPGQMDRITSLLSLLYDPPDRAI